MIRVRKIPLLVLLLILLAGCGKGEETDRVEEEQLTESTSNYSLIDYIPGITFPVPSGYYFSGLPFDKVLMSQADDTFYFGMVSETEKGVLKNYHYNHMEYKTPYLYGAAPEEGISYGYRAYTEYGYGAGSLSFTDRQFELYKPDSFCYEVEVPDSRNEEGPADAVMNIKKHSIAPDITVEEYAEILKSVSFIHIDDISITGDVTDLSDGDIYRKYIPARFETFDDTTLYGFICIMEYMDKQYFYLGAENTAPDDKDIREMLNLTVPNETDIYRVFRETEERSGTKNISFDINGTAAEIEVPGYLRTSEIGNNIYSSALTYIQEENRYTDNPVLHLPNSYGSTELFLKNEYLNLSVTFNSLMKTDYMRDAKDFIYYYFYLINFPQTGISYMDVWNMIDRDDGRDLIERDSVTDRDGSIWQSYLIRKRFSGLNQPTVTPYGDYALIYFRENGDFIDLFAISSGLRSWSSSEALLHDFDHIPGSFSSRKALTERPSGALTFYYLPDISYVDEEDSDREVGTVTDAREMISGDLDSGEKVQESGESVSPDSILEDLGLTQEDIDSAPDIPAEE